MGNYVKIEFAVGSKLEAAIEELLKYKEQGILACGDFNGFTFYSDTVTMDGAYRKITGKSKADFDLELQEQESLIIQGIF